MSAIASLPMYDLPEVRAATDRWWRGLAEAFRAQGVAPVPVSLHRDDATMSVWRSDTLVFSQTCGFPYASALRGVVQLLATPCYAVPGCDGPCYTSHIVVREDDGAGTLAELDGASFAVNGLDSWSGWHSLRREMRTTGLDPDVSLATYRVTGAHRDSIRAVADGHCRACAVDSVTHALLARHAPEALLGTRVLHTTQSAPALPYITRASMPQCDVLRLRAGLRQALAEPALAGARDTLAIGAVQELGEETYTALLHRA